MTDEIDWRNAHATDEQGRPIQHFEPKAGTPAEQRERATGIVGWRGVYPTTACSSCGHAWFRWMGDWGMGYLCENCGERWREPGKTLAESLGMEVPKNAPGGKKLGPAAGDKRTSRRAYHDAEYEGFADVDGFNRPLDGER